MVKNIIKRGVSMNKSTTTTNNNPTIKVPVECYSRVVGYFRPVSQWNKGKQAEFGDRMEFVVSGADCAC